MSEKHPLDVSNEVLCQWYKDYLDGAKLDRDEWPAGHLTTYIGVKAAQWGYDQAIEHVYEIWNQLFEEVERDSTICWRFNRELSKMRPQEDN